MKAKAHTYIATCCLALLFAACGQQHKAESVVEDFMERNLTDPSALEDLDFNDIDSTRHINDSIVAIMRQATKATAPQYKKTIDYGTKQAVGNVLLVRVNYKVGEKRFTDTYYLDKEMTDVIAFKSMEN